MSQPTALPINTVHLLPLLDAELIALLERLSPSDWQRPTIARQWCVKDVTAHLLDGNIRILSMLRDKHTGVRPDFANGQSLLDFLNTLNAEWVRAMKRVSPEMLILLHKATGKLYCDYYASLDPYGKAGFAVNWAGEEESTNWMHIAREYTEKWLHQQQIREAVQQPGLMQRNYFYPFIQTFMMALPYTFRNCKAAEQASVNLTITGDAGGSWEILFSNGKWAFTQPGRVKPAASVVIDPDTSWKLFSKSLRPADSMQRVQLTGDLSLAHTVLEMVSVMA